jgi:hypothetical protein
MIQLRFDYKILNSINKPQIEIFMVVATLWDVEDLVGAEDCDDMVGLTVLVARVPRTPTGHHD